MDLKIAPSTRRHELAGFAFIAGFAAAAASFLLPWVPVPYGVRLAVTLLVVATVFAGAGLLLAGPRRVGALLAFTAVLGLVALSVVFSVGPTMHCWDGGYVRHDFEGYAACSS
jgi:hypothetical protein